MKRIAFFAATLIAVVPQAPGADAAGGWKAGVAKTVITPEEPTWMSGYARTHPAVGKQQDLWAKALALEDADGRRAVLITMDLIGLDRQTSARICERLAERHKLERRQIALNASHTHCGPVVGHNLEGLFALDDEQRRKVDEYTRRLIDKLVAIAGEAIAHLRPGQLAWGQGYCSFAVNRRENPHTGVERLRALGQLRGPSDYDVPVLAVRDAAGELQAIEVAARVEFPQSPDWPAPLRGAGPPNSGMRVGGRSHVTGPRQDRRLPALPGTRQVCDPEERKHLRRPRLDRWQGNRPDAPHASDHREVPPLCGMLLAR